MKDIVLTADDIALQKFITLVDSEEIKVYKELDIVRRKILGIQGQNLAQETWTLYANWKPIRDEAISLVKQGNKKRATQITIHEGAYHVSLLEEKMLALNTYARDKADNFFNESSKVQNRVVLTTSIIIGVGILLSFLIAVFTFKQIMQSIKKRRVVEEEREKLITELQNALDEIKTFSGIIPICMHCKEIRDDEGYWNQLEKYISDHSEAQFSHSVCDKCKKIHYKEILK